jgi:VacB/RNase II family 3'-5' exoribonuclease
MSKSNPPFNLAAAAHAEMLRRGFHPDFSPAIAAQTEQIRQQSQARLASPREDLRQLLWSSIDNDTSRDLDQIEWAERTEQGIRVLVAIADVDSAVTKGSPIDLHAADQTTSVYTPAIIFPMLPEELSTDLTSLAENQDRGAIVIEFVVLTPSPAADCGCKFEDVVTSSRIYRALVHNRAQLAYDATSAWLDNPSAASPKIAASADLQAQLRLQDEAAQILRQHRILCGALDFDRIEPQAQVTDGQVTSLDPHRKGRANDLIEDFMIAANEVMARSLSAANRSSIRRIVRVPKRWDRIVSLAADLGTTLPTEPDSAALNDFLELQHKKDPLRYPDLSLAVIKLMGPGIYVLSNSSTPEQGHFGLAATDYTHSTAPNRRYADVIIQRVIKAQLDNVTPPYSDGELDTIAQHCTEMEDAAKKVERTTLKMAAALSLRNQIGQSFDGIVTGASDKGTYVRLINPLVEGRVMQGAAGMDVGDQVTVKLLRVNPERGFIDFAH